MCTFNIFNLFLFFSHFLSASTALLFNRLHAASSSSTTGGPYIGFSVIESGKEKSFFEAFTNPRYGGELQNFCYSLSPSPTFQGYSSGIIVDPEICRPLLVAGLNLGSDNWGMVGVMRAAVTRFGHPLERTMLGAVGGDGNVLKFGRNSQGPGSEYSLRALGIEAGGLFSGLKNKRQYGLGLDGLVEFLFGGSESEELSLVSEAETKEYEKYMELSESDHRISLDDLRDILLDVYRLGLMEFVQDPELQTKFSGTDLVTKNPDFRLFYVEEVGKDMLDFIERKYNLELGEMPMDGPPHLKLKIHSKMLSWCRALKAVFEKEDSLKTGSDKFSSHDESSVIRISSRVSNALAHVADHGKESFKKILSSSSNARITKMIAPGRGLKNNEMIIPFCPLRGVLAFAHGIEEIDDDLPDDYHYEGNGAQMMSTTEEKKFYADKYRTEFPTLAGAAPNWNIPLMTGIAYKVGAAARDEGLDQKDRKRIEGEGAESWDLGLINKMVLFGEERKIYEKMREYQRNQ